MVREFTELQGTMGGIYAREAGEPAPVWKAIYSHYLPTAVEAEAAPAASALGEAKVTWACLALADKLDTLVGLFRAGERPTGSRDPHGLRRQAHGILRILADAEPLTGVRVRLPLETLIAETHAGFGSSVPEGVDADLSAFLADRLQYFFEARGADRRTVRAVIGTEGAALRVPVADLQENLRALPEFARSEQFRQLATAFKRVRNIAREIADADYRTAAASPPVARLTEAAEKALLAELSAREPAIQRAVTDGRGYREAYAEAARFEPVVARFFNDVFVMAEDASQRHARLWLMKRLEQVILQLGDISEIVAPESEH
jgi:glycyl-tRNA synthetase beta chain